MKTLNLILLSFVLCYFFAVHASASNYKEGLVYRTRTVEPKRAIEQPKIVVDSLIKRKTSTGFSDKNRKKIKTASTSEENKKKSMLRRRSKITATSRTPSSSFHTRKNRTQIKSKVNRFEDKNGDGINDFVKNPKL